MRISWASINRASSLEDIINESPHRDRIARHLRLGHRFQVLHDAKDHRKEVVVEDNENEVDL